MKILIYFLVTIVVSYYADAALNIPQLDFKDEMRKFVVEIANYARLTIPNFIVIPQNGLDIVTKNGLVSGTVDTAYMNAINGVGCEDLFYGMDADNVATKLTERNYLISFLDLVKRYGKTVLVTDYCSTPSKMDDSYTQNFNKGYLSFAANRRDLDVIPAYPAKPINENANHITSLNLAKNFLYLINPQFNTKTDFLNAVKKTNYDVVLIDAFFHDQLLTYADVQSLKVKANGGRRLVIAYMSIGEAEDYRYYWRSWKIGAPSFLDAMNPNWQGNYKVRYWDPNWKQVIYGNDASYTKRLLSSGFDGTYLDIIDAFEYYENLS